MFIVFNKDKICSYLISVGIVAVLFTMPLVIKDKQAYETSARVNQIQETTVNEEKNENKANEMKSEKMQNSINEIKSETIQNTINEIRWRNK